MFFFFKFYCIPVAHTPYNLFCLQILNLACGSGEGEALTSTAPLIENSALPELTIDIPPMQESFSSVQEVESIMPHFMPSCYSNHQYIQGLIMPVPAEDVQTSRPNSRQSSEAKNDAVHQESSSTNEGKCPFLTNLSKIYFLTNSLHLALSGCSFHTCSIYFFN